MYLSPKKERDVLPGASMARRPLEKVRYVSPEHLLSALRQRRMPPTQVLQLQRLAGNKQTTEALMRPPANFEDCDGTFLTESCCYVPDPPLVAAEVIQRCGACGDADCQYGEKCGKPQSLGQFMGGYKPPSVWGKGPPKAGPVSAGIGYPPLGAPSFPPLGAVLPVPGSGGGGQHLAVVSPPKPAPAYPQNVYPPPHALPPLPGPSQAPGPSKVDRILTRFNNWKPSQGHGGIRVKGLGADEMRQIEDSLDHRYQVVYGPGTGDYAAKEQMKIIHWMVKGSGGKNATFHISYA